MQVYCDERTKIIDERTKIIDERTKFENYPSYSHPAGPNIL
jgi:hypothetical protein